MPISARQKVDAIAKLSGCHELVQERDQAGSRAAYLYGLDQAGHPTCQAAVLALLKRMGRLAKAYREVCEETDWRALAEELGERLAAGIVRLHEGYDPAPTCKCADCKALANLKAAKEAEE